MKKQWATVAVLLNESHHICVKLEEDETAEDVKKRVEDSMWGPPARVKGIYDTPWGR